MSEGPAVARRSGGGGSRIACCCVGGCGLLVLVIAGLAAVGWFQFGVPVIEGIESVKRAEEEQAIALAELDRLDEQAGSDVPEDPSAFVLDEPTLDAYVAVRRALAPQLVAVADAREALRAGVMPDGAAGAGDVFRAALGATRGATGLATARRDLLQEAVVVLEREGLAPAEAEATARAVEHAFLEEPGALALGLPEWRRDELFSLRVEVALLEGWGESGFQIQVNDRDAEEALADARARLEEIEAEAAAARALHPQTRALLESRRAELERLATEAAPLAILFEPTDTGIQID